MYATVLYNDIIIVKYLNLKIHYLKSVIRLLFIIIKIYTKIYKKEVQAISKIKLYSKTIS